MVTQAPEESGGQDSLRLVRRRSEFPANNRRSADLEPIKTVKDNGWEIYQSSVSVMDLHTGNLPYPELGKAGLALHYQY